MRIFLGGTCNGSKWRESLIPYITCDYFNPVVENWDDAAKERERYEREHCDYVLYGITPRMKGVYSISELVDDSNKRPKRTLFLLLKNDIADDGSLISFDKEEMNSLNEVANMVNRNGGFVFHSLYSFIIFITKIFG